jgi:hypothetical protein
VQEYPRVRAQVSVDLGNSSHFDVHDASQGFAVWTEEVPGHGEKWCFVLPNVHGLKPDGVTKFHGMVVKLGHRVAISWDGRVIRHCTSVSHPDGLEYAMAGKVKDSHFCIHLYGTFTAATRRELFGQEGPRLQQVGLDNLMPTWAHSMLYCVKANNLGPA